MGTGVSFLDKWNQYPPLSLSYWMHYRTLKMYLVAIWGCRTTSLAVSYCLFSSILCPVLKSTPNQKVGTGRIEWVLGKTMFPEAQKKMGIFPHVSSPSTCTPILREFCPGGWAVAGVVAEGTCGHLKFWGRGRSSTLSWEAGFSREWIKHPLLWLSSVLLDLDVRAFSGSTQ